MDEFHFYAEPDRGWAWQVPLLELPQAQFVLMSATLGDVTELAADLTRRNGRETALVTDAERPVPLTFTWALTPAGRDARGAGHHPPGAGLRRALHPEGRRRARHRAAQRQARHRRRGRADGAAGRLPVRRRLRQDAVQAAPPGDRRAPRRDCCRATGAWSSSWPRPGCSPSSAAPTPSASASTCRSGPCCSPGSRSTTATAAGCCGPGSSSRSPAAPAAPASTSPATSSSRRPSTPSRTSGQGQVGGQERRDDPGEAAKRPRRS